MLHFSEAPEEFQLELKRERVTRINGFRDISQVSLPNRLHLQMSNAVVLHLEETNDHIAAVLQRSYTFQDLDTTFTHLLRQ